MLQWQLAGLIMGVVGGSVVLNDIPLLVRAIMRGPDNSSAAPRAEGPLSMPGVEWPSLVLGLILLVGGVYAIVSPRSVVRWAARTLPGRAASEDDIAKSLVMARLIGTLMIAGGITAFLAWLGKI